jgi:hypothetical protein
MWQEAAAAWPKNVALSPFDLAQQAALMRKTGDLGSARQLEARLDGMGYRHPDYVRDRARRGEA